MAEPEGLPPGLLELRADYEWIRELGRGGTAVVYLARERELGRQVAIKVVRSILVEDEEAVARLAREARTVAQLQHPHIVTLFGTRRLADRSLALIMQYVPGRTVKESIAAEGPFSFERTERVLREMAEALAYAHVRGIVHRDIKPENIYLDEATGRALLSDFGIARAESDSSLTLTGVAIGTPAYMSPEQIDGGRVDGRSDLYSLGLVGFEMLTGRRPWEGETLYSVIYKQKNEELPSLATLRPGVPPRLRRALEGALRKDPAERWSSATEFLAALVPGTAWVESPRPTARGGPRQSDAGDARVAVPDPDSAPTVRFRPGQVPEREVPRADGPAETADPVGSRPGEPGSEAGSEAEAGSAAGPEARSEAGPAPDGRERSERAEAVQARSGEERGDEHEEEPERPEAAGAVVAASEAAGAGGVQPRTAFDELRELTDAESEPVGGPEPEPAAEVPGDGRRKRLVIVAAAVGVLLLGTAATVAMMHDRADRDAGSVPVLVGGDGPVSETVAVAPIGTDSHGEEMGLHAAGRLLAVSGDGQRGVPGSALPSPLTVKVEDEGGRPLAGARVAFRVTAGGGEVRPERVMTDSTGTARTVWTLGPDMVPGTVLATVDGFPELVVSFNARSGAGSPSRITTVAGDGQQAAPGATLSEPLTVRVEDRAGRPVPGVRVEFRVAYGGGLLSPRTAVTNASGLAQATWTLGSTTEPSSVIASVGGAGGPQVTFNARAAWPRASARRAIVAGGLHTCAISGEGRVSCWGGNESGQLGDGGTSRRAAPTAIGGALRFVSIAAGISHSCAVTADGDVYCWGSNHNGQLGDGTDSRRLEPARVPVPSPVSSVSAGTAHTCALARSGDAYCWGANPGGQLGDGTRSDRNAPVLVTGGHSFTAVSAGWSHTCAVSRQGVAWCWGRNAFGQVGNGTTMDRSVPTRVAGGARFRDVATGSAHTCATGEGGRVFCWGQNASGQLGDGTTVDRYEPVAVEAAESFVSVVTGSVHSCALTEGGDAFCWGRNTYGQLGDATTEDRARPVKVQGGHTFSLLEASGAHTCGLTVMGEEMCWGYNLEGQLGDGSRSNRTVPVRVGRTAGQRD